MRFALQTKGGVRTAALSLLLAIAAAPAAAQVTAAQLEQSFADSCRDGPDSGAARDLRRHGRDAVRFLVEVLERSTDNARQRVALEHLMRMGPNALAVVPTLLEMVGRDDELLDPVILALGEIGPFEPEAASRHRIALALEACALRRPHPEGRRARLARAWSRVQVGARHPIDELVALLRGGNPFHIELACQMLTVAGPDAQRALPAIAELVQQRAFVPPPAARDELQRVGMAVAKDWQAEVRGSLYYLVTQIAPDDPVAVPLYQHRLDRAEPDQQLPLVQLLGRVGAGAAPAVPLLSRLARESRMDVRREAATALGMIGRAAAAAVPTLQGLATGSDAQLAARAKAALRQIEADADAAGR